MGSEAFDTKIYRSLLATKNIRTGVRAWCI